MATINTATSVTQTLANQGSTIVTANGTLVTSADSAIKSAGVSDIGYVINDGLIATTGFFDVIRLGGQGSGVWNTGSIQARADAISFTFKASLNSFANSDVFNSGDITSTRDIAVNFGHYAVNLTNTGTIAGFDFAVYVGIPNSGGSSTALNTLVNSGSIVGALGSAIRVEAGITRLSNTGEILGDVTLKLATGESMTSAGNVVTNSGLIDGDVLMGARSDLFRNLGDGLVSGQVSGEDGNDTLRGASRDDALDGGVGNDSVTGSYGNDSLSGGRDEDTLRGGEGDDTLTGGDGADILTGGAGADVFVYLTPPDSADRFGIDTLTDFSRKIDVIDLDAVAAGDLVFVGAGAFAGGGQGSVQVLASGGDRQVLVDVNGDALADMIILVEGAAALKAADFLL